MRDSRHQTATVYSLVLLFGIVSSSCATTFSKEQIADNSAALAQTFVDCVWDIDPEIYFDDARLAGHAFRHAPRVMKSAEYHGKPGTRNSRGLAGQQHFEESRLFSLDLPIVPANAIDEKREPTELPAQFCLQVSVRYEADAAVYYFEFFTPRVAIHKQQRLVRDGKYVADLDARSDYALPAAADAVIADLQKRGLPLDFAAQVFKVSDDLRAVKTGAEFLMGSGRVLVTEDVNSASTRLDQLQAIVRLRDGMTARSLYDRVLKIDRLCQSERKGRGGPHRSARTRSTARPRHGHVLGGVGGGSQRTELVVTPTVQSLLWFGFGCAKPLSGQSAGDRRVV